MFKKPILELHTWYKQLDDVDVMLVVEYPWYHPRRWQGYRFRDNLGYYRTVDGNLKDDRMDLRDIAIRHRLIRTPK